MSPEELDRHARTREDRGLRADPDWVAWVAEHGRDGGMTLNIPLTEAELAELESRSERAAAANGAFLAANLRSAAGFWCDQGAGGLLHYVLARPDPDELATARRIADEHGGTVDLVEHSTRELDRVRALIHDARDADPALAEALTGWSTDVWANAVRLTVRGDLDPELPASLRDAAAAGTLVVDHPREPYGWHGPQPSTPQPSTPQPSSPPPADAPVPRWPREDGEIDPDHWRACVRFVADRCTDGPLDEAVRLAEEIGLRVRVIHPGDGVMQSLVIGRITLYVNAHLVVRWLVAE